MTILVLLGEENSGLSTRTSAHCILIQNIYQTTNQHVGKYVSATNVLFEYLMVFHKHSVTDVLQAVVQIMSEL